MNRNKITILGMIALAGTLTACSVDSGFEVVPHDAQAEAIDPTPADGEARVFTTTADGANALAQSSVATFSGTNMAPTTIQLDFNKQYQTIDGFGFALTYSTCYNLMQMTDADRHALLEKTYSTTAGYGVSYARISLGCSDFSSTEYSYAEEKGPDDNLLANFSLQGDETNYIIPVIKEILSINPDLKIMASPWTCPRWMKVTDLLTKTPYSSWTNGHLNPDYRDAYAEYFVKFIEAMKAQGIDIYSVTPQNEPLNPGNCTSLYMPWQEEAAFVKSLAAAFKQAGISTKIYLYDHNYDYAAGQEDYPVKIYNALGNSYEGSELVVGAAYHDYGGSPDELTDIYTKAPDKELVFTESSIGTWNNGRDLGSRLIADMQNVVLGTVNRMCKTVMVWNFMLDDKMGPNLDGGCQTCYGAIDINSADYSRLSYNSHYYVIAHMSSVVEPGAVRLGVSRDAQVSGLSHADFLNPDGTCASVLCNAGDDDASVTISDGEKSFLVTVPAKAVVSTRWNR